MDLFSVVVRTLFFYLFVTIAYRIMGKREVGKLGIVDLTVSILIAELVAISIENFKEPIYLTIVPIIILVVLEIVVAFVSIKNERIRNILEGKPSLIIAGGKINFHEMVKQRYSLDDLLMSLRSKEISDISEVEYAFLESNGTLSIFKYLPFKLKRSFPLPLILDGKVQIDSLKYLHKSEKWLNNVLIDNNLKLGDIFYAFYKKKKVYFIKKSGN